MICIDATDSLVSWHGPVHSLSRARAEAWLSQPLSSAARRARAEGCGVFSHSKEGRSLARRLRARLRPFQAADMADVALDLGLNSLALAYQAHQIAADAGFDVMVDWMRTHGTSAEELRAAQILAALEVL
jgi:hypothetical protein